jgi:hypothetical protein
VATVTVAMAVKVGGPKTTDELVCLLVVLEEGWVRRNYSETLDML